MRANYVVCYDIRDERRLARVYRFMRQRGLHIQYSVFYCRLSWNDLVELKESLRNMIDGREDDLRIYPLPHDVNIMTMGCGDRIPKGVDIFLS